MSAPDNHAPEAAPPARRYDAIVREAYAHLQSRNTLGAETLDSLQCKYDATHPTIGDRRYWKPRADGGVDWYVPPEGANVPPPIPADTPLLPAERAGDVHHLDAAALKRLDEIMDPTARFNSVRVRRSEAEFMSRRLEEIRARGGVVEVMRELTDADDLKARLRPDDLPAWRVVDGVWPDGGPLSVVLNSFETQRINREMRLAAHRDIEADDARRQVVGRTVARGLRAAWTLFELVGNKRIFRADSTDGFEATYADVACTLGQLAYIAHVFEPPPGVAITDVPADGRVPVTSMYAWPIKMYFPHRDAYYASSPHNPVLEMPEIRKPIVPEQYCVLPNGETVDRDVVYSLAGIQYGDLAFTHDNPLLLTGCNYAIHRGLTAAGAVCDVVAAWLGLPTGRNGLVPRECDTALYVAAPTTPYVDAWTGGRSTGAAGAPEYFLAYDMFAHSSTRMSDRGAAVGEVWDKVVETVRARPAAATDADGGAGRAVAVALPDAPVWTWGRGVSLNTAHFNVGETRIAPGQIHLSEAARHLYWHSRQHPLQIIDVARLPAYLQECVRADSQFDTDLKLEIVHVHERDERIRRDPFTDAELGVGAHLVYHRQPVGCMQKRDFNWVSKEWYWAERGKETNHAVHGDLTDAFDVVAEAPGAYAVLAHWARKWHELDPFLAYMSAHAYASMLGVTISACHAHFHALYCEEPGYDIALLDSFAWAQSTTLSVYHDKHLGRDFIVPVQLDTDGTCPRSPCEQLALLVEGVAEFYDTRENPFTAWLCAAVDRDGAHTAVDVGATLKPMLPAIYFALWGGARALHEINAGHDTPYDGEWDRSPPAEWVLPRAHYDPFALRQLFFPRGYVFRQRADDDIVAPRISESGPLSREVLHAAAERARVEIEAAGISMERQTDEERVITAGVCMDAARTARMEQDAAAGIGAGAAATRAKDAVLRKRRRNADAAFRKKRNTRVKEIAGFFSDGAVDPGGRAAVLLLRAGVRVRNAVYMELPLPCQRVTVRVLVRAYLGDNYDNADEFLSQYAHLALRAPDGAIVGIMENRPFLVDAVCNNACSNADSLRHTPPACIKMCEVGDGGHLEVMWDANAPSGVPIARSVYARERLPMPAAAYATGEPWILSGATLFVDATWDTPRVPAGYTINTET